MQRESEVNFQAEAESGIQEDSLFSIVASQAHVGFCVLHGFVSDVVSITINAEGSVHQRKVLICSLTS